MALSIFQMFGRKKEKKCSDTSGKSHIPELEKLTGELPTFQDLIHRVSGREKVEVDMVVGDVQMEIIFRTKRVGDETFSLGIAEALEDSEMNWHSHEEDEYFILLDGDMRIKKDGGPDKTFSKGAFTRVCVGVPHYVTLKQGTKVIIITIPAAEGWPDE